MTLMYYSVYGITFNDFFNE